MYHSKIGNQIHIQESPFLGNFKDYDDQYKAKEFFQSAKFYKNLPFAHSNTCPYRIFRKNCEKEGIEVKFSENY